MADKFNIEDLGLPELLKTFDALKKKINENADAMSGATKRMSDANTKYIKSVTDVDARINELTKDIGNLKNKQDDLKNKVKQGQITQDKYNREMAETSHAISRANNDRKKYINIIQSEVGSIKRAKAENAIWRRERNEMGKITKKNRLQLEQYNKRIDKNTKLIKKNVDAQSKSFMAGNKLAGVFRNLAGAMGVTLGAYGIFRVIKNSIGIMTRFEASMSKVRAVTGATSKEIERLKLDAIRLGGVTPKTASEVANLQYEFAKLGFTTNEILAATEATISLSIAAGSDLAQAAEVAGSTIRGFGLRATETQRVVDVMADSISSSALNMERFAESMKYVAPIGKAAGLSVEYITAMLSKMADAGIHGSRAGTSLRMIISQLDKVSGGTAQAIKNLSEKGLTLAGAQEEVGQRAKTALLILADQAEEVENLAEQYENASGAAKEMADVMQKNVKGEVKKVTSAWEKFILAGREATGILRGFLGLIRTFIEGMTPFDEESAKMVKYNEYLKDITNSIMGLNDEAAKDKLSIWVERLDKSIYLTQQYLDSDVEKSRRMIKTAKAQIKAYDELQTYIANAINNTEELHKLTKVADEEENKAKDKKTGIINELNEQMKIYRDLKREATDPKMIAYYNDEIKRLQGLLKQYNEMSNALDKIVPKVAQVTGATTEAPPIKAELKYEAPKKTVFDKIKEYLGLTKENLEEITDAADIMVNEITNMLEKINAATLAAAEDNLEIHEERLEELKDKLEDEKDLKDKGKANDYDRLITQIAEEKRLRDSAAKDLKEAQKREAQINLASQTSSIITATAKTIEGWSAVPFVGVLLGLAQVAAMVAAFASYKSKIRSLETYGEGGEIEGKSHKEGGKIIEAEGGEYITNKKATSKSKKLLEAINKGKINDELYRWALSRDTLPDNAQKDSAEEVVRQLERQEKLQRETLEYMKSKPSVVYLGNGKVMITKGDKVEICKMQNIDARI